MDWGQLSEISKYAGILTGILGMWIVIVMGYIRESARAPYLIYNIISVYSSDNHLTPFSLDKIFIVWGLVLVTVMIAFWLTSKVITHHPEKVKELDSSEKDTDDEADVTKETGKN